MLTVTAHTVGTMTHPANRRRWHNAGLLLGQRRRRWANGEPALDQRLMFAGQRWIPVHPV